MVDIYKIKKLDTLLIKFLLETSRSSMCFIDSSKIHGSLLIFGSINFCEIIILKVLFSIKTSLLCRLKVANLESFWRYVLALVSSLLTSKVVELRLVGKCIITGVFNDY